MRRQRKIKVQGRESGDKESRSCGQGIREEERGLSQPRRATTKKIEAYTAVVATAASDARTEEGHDGNGRLRSRNEKAR